MRFDVDADRVLFVGDEVVEFFERTADHRKSRWYVGHAAARLTVSRKGDVVKVALGDDYGDDVGDVVFEVPSSRALELASLLRDHGIRVF